jgi:hypothetical protein
MSYFFATTTLTYWRHDTRHNDIQHNDTLSIMEFGTEYCYAECHLCCMSFMLSVTNKPFMLNVVMPSVIMLNAMAPAHYCKL